MFFRLSQLVFVAVASAAMVPFGTNNGIHLAVEPSCGPLSGAPVDINEGLSPLSSYKTIIAFGVCLLHSIRDNMEADNNYGTGRIQRCRSSRWLRTQARCRHRSEPEGGRSRYQWTHLGGTSGRRR